MTGAGGGASVGGRPDVFGRQRQCDAIGVFAEVTVERQALTASAAAAQMIRTTGGQTQGTESPAPSTIQRCRRSRASATRMQGVSGSARAHAHGGHAASPTRHVHCSPTCCLQWMRLGRAVDRCGRPPRQPRAPSTSRYYSILLYNTSIHSGVHHDHQEDDTARRLAKCSSRRVCRFQRIS